MEILIRILLVVNAIVCLLLIGIILIQRSKGHGAGLSFGGGAEAVFGAQVGNILTRATVVLGVLFLVITTVIAILRPSGRGSSVIDRVSPAASPAGSDAPVVSPVTDFDTFEFQDETEMYETEVFEPTEIVEPAASAEIVESASADDVTAIDEATEIEASASASVEPESAEAAKEETDS